MADNDQINDEYQFTELDPMDPNVLQKEQGSAEDTEEMPARAFSSGHNVKRNAIIVVAVFVVLMLTYKFIGSYFTGKKVVENEIKPTLAVPNAIQPAPSSVVTAPPPPVRPVSTPVPPDLASEVHSQLSALSLSEDNLSTEVSLVHGKIGMVNNNLESLSHKLNELNRMIAALSDKVDSQARTIERLAVKSTVNKAQHSVVRSKPRMNYNLQAVIPGRAWIVATNGTTLTVREGSKIPGFGLVKLIDPNQGRVITSSGRVIRFSQEDS